MGERQIEQGSPELGRNGGVGPLLRPTRAHEAEWPRPTPKYPPDRASGTAFLYMASARFPSRFGSQKLETAAERRRSDLKRDGGRFRAPRTQSARTGPPVTNRLDLAFGLQNCGQCFATEALGGGFGAWGDWRVLMDDSPLSPA